MRRRSDERAKKEEKKTFSSLLSPRKGFQFYSYKAKGGSQAGRKKNLNSKDFFSMYLCVCVCKKRIYQGLRKLKEIRVEIYVQHYGLRMERKGHSFIRKLRSSFQQKNTFEYRNLQHCLWFVGLF